MGLDAHGSPRLDGRTYCGHGVDIAATCYACRRETVQWREVRHALVESDRVDARGDTQGDGRGCALAVMVMLALPLLALLVMVVVLWA